MERNFLKEVVKGYLVDNDVYGEFNESQIKTIHKTIEEELIFVCGFMYEVDIDSYNEVLEMSKIGQQQVFENYLNYTFSKDNALSEFSMNPLQGNMGSSDVAIPYPTGVEHNFITKGAEAVVGGVDSAAGAVGGAAVGIANMVGAGLGLIKNVVLHFYAHFSAYSYLVFIIFIWVYRKTISKTLVHTLFHIGKVCETSGTWLSKQGRYAKFRYAIIEKNRTECYKKCGIKDLDKDINVNYYLNKHSGDAVKDKTVTCLSQCYLEIEIKKVQLITKLYFVCLRQTNAFNEFKKLSTAQTYEILLKSNMEHRNKSYAVSSACGDYYNVLNQNMIVINDLIGYLFKNKMTQQELRMTIQKNIDETKTSVVKMQQQELQQFRFR